MVLLLLVQFVFAELAFAQLPAGYRNYEQFRQQAEQLAESHRIELSELGQTAQSRGVLLLTVSAGGESEPAKPKPAVLLLGSVQADSLVGSHLAMELVEQLASNEALLDNTTFYIIPRPSPDASERLFAAPLQSTAVNHRPADDDRDGQRDEDPAEDLNGDGMITMMRVADEAGDHMAHPDEPRVMVRADPIKGERGTHRLFIEGVDNDGDKQWNEDGAGGVDFNRNFTFRYPYFKSGAGPHQVSEPETRAVANFAFDHPNIFLVYSLAPQDNLNHPWKAKSGDGRIKRSVQGDDVKYLDQIAAQYKEIVKPKDAPKSLSGDGAFVPWAYHHFGRWSIASRVWWLPKTTDSEKAKNSKEPATQEGNDDQNSGAEDSANESASDATANAADDSAEKKPATEDERAKDKKSDGKPDKRGEADRRALDWLDAEGRGGFVEWSAIEHPDFPDKQVEVGGFHPGVREHPPIEQLQAEPLAKFLTELAAKRARIEILSSKVESLGKGITRVTAEVINRGDLPTLSDMGQTARQHQRLLVELTGPKQMQVLDGPLRQDLGVLAPGGVAKRTWLVLLPADADAGSLQLKAGEPSIGFVDKTLEAAKGGKL